MLKYDKGVKMEKNIQLTSYRINQLEFKFNEAIKPGVKFNINPKIECKVGRKDKTLFVNLSAKVNDDLSSPVPFNLYAAMFATFIIQNEVEQNVYAQEAMDVLYPFLRAAIASITANCNIPAYVLPYINQNMMQEGQPAKENGDLN